MVETNGIFWNNKKWASYLSPPTITERFYSFMRAKQIELEAAITIYKDAIF